VFLIALTGGIASGKSTVARRLAEHGAIVVDADVLARRAVEPGSPALAQIVEAFGPDILDRQGVLNRSKLGKIVFHDTVARDRLNAIVHPAVQRLATEAFARLATEDSGAVVVYDVPLFAEVAHDYSFDMVVVTDAPKHTQMRRLTEIRGLDSVQAAARIDSQSDSAVRRALADIVVDTDGSLADTMSAVDELWFKIQAAKTAAGK